MTQASDTRLLSYKRMEDLREMASWNAPWSGALSDALAHIDAQAEAIRVMREGLRGLRALIDNSAEPGWCIDRINEALAECERILGSEHG